MLHLKDGSVVSVEEFWTLFVLDEVLVERCYELPEIMSGAPYDWIIDVGANVGLFSLRAKQLWPQASILALEPHPDNFRRLNTLISINSLRDIRCLQVGVGETCGSGNMYIDPRNTAGHSMYKGMESGHSVLPIEIRTLADLLGDFCPSGKGLMKIDCEGCEFPLISSLTADVATQISCIVIEPERGIGFNLDKLVQKLRGLGYTVRDDSHFVIASR